ncbi:hypothetical protein PanWU01x14_170910, partial [Parasponia andersonii]
SLSQTVLPLLLRPLCSCVTLIQLKNPMPHMTINFLPRNELLLNGSIVKSTQVALFTLKISSGYETNNITQLNNQTFLYGRSVNLRKKFIKTEGIRIKIELSP